jgi:hypothetical protein
MSAKRPSNFPSFVYRQDGHELSYEIAAIIPAKALFVNVLPQQSEKPLTFFRKYVRIQLLNVFEGVAGAAVALAGQHPVRFAGLAGLRLRDSCITPLAMHGFLLPLYDLCMDDSPAGSFFGRFSAASVLGCQ